jgi:MarR family transcriptional regulator, organic hydroperoxide resistance regulator
MTRELEDLLHICACSSLRKSTRVVTQLYDKILQPTGLKVTQYSMLVNIVRNKDITISHLGEVMLLDQTTVTRNVDLLKKSGFVTLTKDKNDSRTKTISLTDKGIEKLNEARPIWLQLQERFLHDIGKEQYHDFLETLQSIQKLIKSYE